MQAINDETSPLLSPRERAAVRFAEKLAVDHHKIDDEQWAELRQHFSESELLTTTTWRRSRANSIEGGTAEIQLNVIAKRVLGLPD